MYPHENLHSAKIETCAAAAGQLVVSSRNGAAERCVSRTALLLPDEISDTVVFTSSSKRGPAGGLATSWLAGLG
jgi:hypothetical protein